VLAIPLIVLVVSLVLLGWAEYNWLRFQNRDDCRMVADNVSLDEMAQDIGATKASSSSAADAQLRSAHERGGGAGHAQLVALLQRDAARDLIIRADDFTMPGC